MRTTRIFSFQVCCTNIIFLSEDLLTAFQTSGSIATEMALISRVAVCVHGFRRVITFADFVLVDYNSWIDSDKARRLRTTLDPDTVLAEGYKEYDTGRQYLVGMGDWRNNKDEEVELDGIGGVNIVVKADVHRSGMNLGPAHKHGLYMSALTLPLGINFPAYAFENQAETEGFAKMAKRAGYQVIGLPNYVVWHIDTDEKPGNLGERKAY